MEKRVETPLVLHQVFLFRELNALNRISEVRFLEGLKTQAKDFCFRKKSIQKKTVEVALAGLIDPPPYHMLSHAALRHNTAPIAGFEYRCGQATPFPGLAAKAKQPIASLC